MSPWVPAAPAETGRTMPIFRGEDTEVQEGEVSELANGTVESYGFLLHET